MSVRRGLVPSPSALVIRVVLGITCFGLLVNAGGRAQLEAQTAHFSYAQSTVDSGFNSPAGLAVDGSGNLYLAVPTSGEVLKETVSAGSYSQSAILTGLNEPYGIAVDNTGALFITCLGDSSGTAGQGSLIKATLSGNSYSSTTLLTGLNDPTAVAVDRAGNLYLTERSTNQAAGTGEVVKETASGTSFTASVLTSGLNYPTGLALDSGGNLYIAVQGNGTNTGAILKESTSGGTPTAILTSVTFNDVSAVAVDGSGNLYVAAPDSGSFALLVETLQSGTSYTQSLTVPGLSEPFGLAVDGNGNIYISDTGNNQLLKVQTRGVDFGSANVATSTPLSETLNFTFDSAGSLNGTTPYQVVTTGTANLDFDAATAQGPGVCSGISSYTAGDTCTVSVAFVPKYPGLRLGGVELLNGSGGLVAGTNVSGTGIAPQVVFPGNTTPLVLGGGFSYPTGVAVDGSNNVYVADYDNNLIKEMPAGCASSGCVTSLGGGFSFPFGLALDGSGNIYVADYRNSAVKEMPAGCASSSCVKTLGGGFSGPVGVAVDGRGNVYITDHDTNTVNEMPAGCASSSCVTTLGGGFIAPGSVAVDGSGNVYVADSGNDAIKEIAPGCASSSCVTTLGGGFVTPFAVAIDAHGDIYVADTFNNALKVMNPGCASSTCVTTLATGFSNPYGVTLSAGGNLYVADTFNNQVKELPLATPPSLSFASTNVASTSSDSPKTVTVANTGNADLSFPAPSTGGNPSIAADFSLDGATTCPELDPSSAAAGTLVAGTTCTLVVDCLPTQAGSLTGSVVLTDNALYTANATQSIGLSGTGNAVAPGAPLNATAVAGNALATVSFSVPASDGGATVTGYTATSSPGAITGTCATSPCTVAGLLNGTAYTFTVTATNAVGTGQASAPSNSVIPATLPDAPAIGAVTLSMAAGGVQEAMVSFTPPVSDGGSTITTYTATSSPGNLPGACTASPCTVTGLKSGTAYTFTVTATNAIGTGPASAASSAVTPPVPTLVVTTAADDAGSAANCTAQLSATTGSDASCALRDALLYASNAGAANINFDTTQFASPTTITLGGAGALSIPTNTTIQGTTSGSGATQTNLVTVSGNNAYQVFSVSGGRIAALAHLTIANGKSNGGGGINNAGTLTVTASTLSGNSATGDGGGIFNSGTLTVTGCTLSENSASSLGGGIYTVYPMTIVNSTFFGNSAALGGAVLTNHGALTITDSTFSGNSASSTGGGIYNHLASVTLANSVVAGNTATSSNADILGPYANAGGNLASNNTNKISTINAGLAPPGTYGGPTLTMRPLPGSAAICAGNAAKIPSGITTDQRGEPNTNSSYSGYTASAPCVDSGAVQTNYALAFSTQPPSSVVTNTPFNAAVTLDESGSALLQSGVSVGLALTGGSSLGSASTSSAGVASFSNLSVPTTTSPQSLTASLTLNTSPAVSVSEDSSTFTVGTGVATHFVVVAPSPVTSYYTYSIAVTALDSNGNVATGYTGSVHLTSTDPGFVNGTGDSTLQNGVGSFNVAQKQAGTQFITATDTADASITGTSASILVNPGPVERIGIAVPPAATLGSQFPFTVIAYDLYGNVVTNYTGTLHFTSSDGAAVLPTNSALTGGAGTFNATLNTQGLQTITVTDTVTSGITTTSGTIVVSIPSIVVTSTADSGSGSLRDALAAAATDGSGNITFDPTLFGTPQTISTASTLNIPSKTTITGPPAGVTISGGGSGSNFSVFTVAGGVTNASIQGMTIANGYTNSQGGAIDNEGSLTVSGTTFVNNYAGGYITGGGNGGGAIYSNSALVIAGSTFTGNTSAPGGAITVNSGTVAISSSTFTGNSAIDNKVGGAIFTNTGTTATIAESTFSRNSAAGGGAVFNNGTLTVINSILSGNSGGDCGAGGSSTCPANGISGNAVGLSNISLSPLGNYGGATQTMIPLPGSPAICAGVNSGLAGTDQRGLPRTTAYGAMTCVDVGAVQTNYSLQFVQQPSSVVQNVPVSPAPTVELLERGAAFADGTDTIAIPLTLTSGSGSLSGVSASTSATTGIAAYSSLSVSQPGTSDQLTASLALNSGTTPPITISAVSSTFNVTSAITQLAFSTAPLVTVTAGGNAGASIVVHEEDTNGALVTTSGDTISLAVTGPRIYAASYTATAINGVATFDLSGAPLNVAGDYIYTASISSSPSVTAATASETVNAASPAAVGVVSGSGQSAVIGTAFASPLIVKVKDQYSNPVVGATVVFSAPASGSGAIFSTPAETASNGSTSVTATANGTASATAYTVTASIAGASSASFQLVNSKAASTLTGPASAVRLVYGVGGKISVSVANPSVGSGVGAPGGTVTYSIGGGASQMATITSGVASLPIPASQSAGNYTVTVSYAGDSNYNAAAPIQVTLHIAQAASTTTLQVSSTSVTPGQSVTLTATVASATTGTPTGAVNFYDGAALLNSAPVALSGGVATCATTALAPGAAHSITAAYSGDANFTASGSVPDSATTIAVGSLDFSLALSGPGTLTVPPGQSTRYQFAVTPDYGSYPGTVSFSIAGLPPGATATFSPESIAANGGAQTITVTIQTATATAMLHGQPPVSPGRRLAPFALAFVFLFGAGRLRRNGRALRGLLCVLALVGAGAAATMLSGCGSHTGFFAQAPQNYTVTVTATAANVQHSAAITLNVQ